MNNHNDRFFIYSNSAAQTTKKQKGFIGVYPHKNVVVRQKKTETTLGFRCKTTTEFAFAYSFATKQEAEEFLRKYDLTGIIFKRVDL